MDPLISTRGSSGLEKPVVSFAVCAFDSKSVEQTEPVSNLVDSRRAGADVPCLDDDAVECSFFVLRKGRKL